MFRCLKALGATSVLLVCASGTAGANPVQGLVDFAAIAEVRADAPVFRFDRQCPEAGARCRTGITLPRGAILMISDPGSEGDKPPPHVRFVYTPDGTRASMAGAVRRSDLLMRDLPPPAAADWTGTYFTVTNPDHGATASLSIRELPGGRLRVAGQAVVGASQGEEPPRDAPQAYIRADVTPRGARAVVGVDDGCRLAFLWLGPYLAVEEDGKPCTPEGGPGFAGLYLREGDQPLNPASRKRSARPGAASGGTPPRAP